MGAEERYQQLHDAVVNMDIAGVPGLVQGGLDEGLKAAELLTKGLSAGMRSVGEQFRDGTLFMPEVLVACDAYYEGLKVLKPLLDADKSVTPKGKMVLGTIFGDIHTVGKDVAIPVFRAAGFEVIDLGIDVPDDKFVEAVQEHQPDLVGLGTYMTATFMHTKQTVEALKKAGLRDKVKVICGGPAVDARTAKTLGADDACDNAWEAVGKMEALVAELHHERGR